MKLDDLRQFDLCYLSSPYSAFPDGIDAAYVKICKTAAKLWTAGINIYCPIAMTHGIAVHGVLDPLDHDIWMRSDRALMKKCDALIVAQLESWKISKGIAHEVDYFLNAGKPIFYLDPKSLGVEAAPESKGCAA